MSHTVERPDAAASRTPTAGAIESAAAGASPRVIERHSIDYVPLRERHGKVWQQGPFWFASNFVIFTLAVGFTGPLTGLGFGWSALAIVLGNVFGAFFMAFHANQGPRLGVPQLIQSRAQFGTRGAVIPVVAALFVYIGFNVFNVPMAVEGFRTVASGGPDWAWYLVITIVQASIAVVGYDLIHLVQRWLTYVLIAFFTVLTVGFVVLLGGPEVLTMGAFNGPGFFKTFTAVAGYMIAYGIYVSDYTRYLPADTKLGPLVAWTYSGVVVAGVWLMALGALFAVALEDGARISSVFTAGAMIAPGLGKTIMVLVSVAVVTIMSVNTYGATLVALTAIDAFRQVGRSMRARITGTLLVSAVGLAVSLTLPERYHATFEGFLALILYFLVPWTAVNLVDYYWVRRGKYSVAELFNDPSVYGRWAWRGLASYAAGFLAMMPFFSVPFFTGPAARALQGVDLSIFIGLPVSALTYYALARSLNLAKEGEAHRRSLAILEPSSVSTAQTGG